MKKQKPVALNLRTDVEAALRRAFPDGAIEPPFVDDSWLCDVYERLKDRLAQIPGASIMDERGPLVPLVHAAQEDSDDFDHEPVPSSLEDIEKSYCIFFLGLTDERFSYECEDGEEDERGRFHKVKGTGTVGCLAGISLIARFAVVVLSDIEFSESGSRTLPDIAPHIFGLDSKPLDLEEHYGEMYGDDGLKVLHQLRDAMVAALASLDIATLPEEELRKTVPWLGCDEGIILEDTSRRRRVTVKDGFFFQYL